MKLIQALVVLLFPMALMAHPGGDCDGGCDAKDKPSKISSIGINLIGAPFGVYSLSYERRISNRVAFFVLHGLEFDKAKFVPQHVISATDQMGLRLGIGAKVYFSGAALAGGFYAKPVAGLIYRSPFNDLAAGNVFTYASGSIGYDWVASFGLHIGAEGGVNFLYNCGRDVAAGQVGQRASFEPAGALYLGWAW